MHRRFRWPELEVIFATGAAVAPGTRGEPMMESALVLRKPYDTCALEAVLRAAGERRGGTR